MAKFEQGESHDLHVAQMMNLYFGEEITCKTIKITHWCCAYHKHFNALVSFQHKGQASNLERKINLHDMELSCFIYKGGLNLGFPSSF